MASVAAARPVVTVYNVAGEEGTATVKIPQVLLAPIRPDIVRFVHTNMAKNKRQAYAVNKKAGHQHSAESWGTGRAVSRIPRVSGGGTHRAGQAAFGNMCRSGRMFAPTRVWRKWHRKINTNQKRYAVVSALAASAVPALVMARGHKIEQIPEVPLVLNDGVQAVEKTKKAIAALTAVKAFADVEKVKDSKKVRTGLGKLRNRRYVQRRGPLVVFAEDQGITKAFRNLPGVELCHVDRLNLLQLAPGGHLGRFVIWTKSAFERLDKVYGTQNKTSETKVDYKVPKAVMTNADLTRIINSDEIQSKLQPVKKNVRNFLRKKNPLKNLSALIALNPYAAQLRRADILRQVAKTKKVAAKKVAKKAAAKPVVKASPKKASPAKKSPVKKH